MIRSEDDPPIGFKVNDNKARYLSFLLRLWPVKENEHTTWRASLESSHTGERHGFADLDMLCAFLRGQIDSSLNLNKTNVERR